MEKNIGRVVQIIGPVLDIKFEGGHLPDLLSAIEIMHEGKKVVCEVAAALGDDVVRCIAMSSTDGMSRGMDAVDTVRYGGNRGTPSRKSFHFCGCRW